MKRKIVALMLIGCMTASMTAFAEESTEGATEGATEAGTEAAADFSDVETVAEGKLISHRTSSMRLMRTVRRLWQALILRLPSISQITWDWSWKSLPLISTAY